MRLKRPGGCGTGRSSTKAAPTCPSNHSVAGLLRPQAEEGHQSARFMLESPYIQGNRQYEGRTDSVTFTFAEEVLMARALATDEAFAAPDGSLSLHSRTTGHRNRRE